MLVENEEGVRFKIGGGFSDKMRRRPPKIGSVITYKYYGKTKNNKPRFASFLRVRENYDFKSPQKIP
ncbi:MAG: DNA ligase-1 [Rickettsiales bacterium]